MAYNVDKLSTIDLGRQGENLARTVEIDVSSLLAQWPEAVISLLVKRKHDPAPYVADTEVVNGILRWPITTVETSDAGDGKIEIRACCGEVIAKSATGTIRVTTSLTGTETDAPESEQGWVDKVVAAGSEATAGAESAKKSAAEAERIAQMLQGTQARVETLAPGSQATVRVEAGAIVYGIPAGATGERGATGLTGQQGPQGERGPQGIPGINAQQFAIRLIDGRPTVTMITAGGDGQ